ncbi:ABC transporter substrate-binding protein [Phytoactinopolyspora mesophila]|uniref:Transporter substrate-binding domain-containing protein n=1 Tax=Phytoactinopolyspora mesophila TaxID=2650750 RepID=A0A7K3MBU4_9ACTN|nr:ABC transporter substrate-binding protein [Phytoactinopolyspora mesophila]NDL60791.1 transporter substrate-binding domain-containing protein [Phytoactinopolyspora mesophila]
MPRLSRAFLASLPITALLLVAACGSDDDGTAASSGDDAADSTVDENDQCTPESLETLTPGTLTPATGQPSYEPWIVGNEPENGEGFEGAVTYAVAERLGFTADDVTWTRVDFNAAIQPGPKDFDFAVSQFSITEERKAAVDFSSSYYDVAQTVIAVEGNPAADAASLEELRDLRLGAQVGTTSLQALESAIELDNEPSVFNTNDDAKLALDNGQIDGLVVDLPTAFYMTAVEIENGVIVGQLPDAGGEPEQFGLLLDKDSALTECVTQAVDSLREDGTLDALKQEWLAEVADAPELS